MKKPSNAFSVATTPFSPPDSHAGSTLKLKISNIDADATRILNNGMLTTQAGGHILTRERNGKLIPERAVYRRHPESRITVGRFGRSILARSGRPARKGRIHCAALPAQCLCHPAPGGQLLVRGAKCPVGHPPPHPSADEPRLSIGNLREAGRHNL